MGIAKGPLIFSSKPSCANSMSHDYHHQGIFSFSNGLDKSATHHHEQSEHHLLHDHHHHHHGLQPQHQHLAQQIRRDKLRVQSFDPPAVSLPLVAGIEEQGEQQLPSGLHHVFETPGTMLSEMFNFAPAATAVEFSDQQPNFRTLRTQPPTSNSAAAMQLFLMNPPPPPRSPSPPSSTSSTLHMLLPNPPSSLQGFEGGAAGGEAAASFGQFAQLNNPTQIGGIVEGQGLSLSLQSSSLQHLEEAAKAEELRIRDGGILYYNQGQGGGGGGSASSILQYSTYRNSENSHGGQPLHNFQGAPVGLGSSLGVVNVLRNSKYAKAAQELLEEFCSVGRVQLKKSAKSGIKHNSNPESTGGIVHGGPSSSSKDQPPLSAADRIEHQRRKVKLLSMLDEVERRYNLYGEQMQMVMNSFDLVMGFGAAAPYTTLTQKAMSRHFRCLKDAISAQLKHSCEVLGEKEAAGSSGVTKGETPRLKLLDQSLRQQRAFHQMGMMEQEAWRPQRGLPERSVSILRAWLFEHFLHPYPSDADKHLLARQTGLSRNQVSNWFINARVRLWKPMVEEMYQLEGKVEEEGSEDAENNNQNSALNAQNPLPPTTASTSSTAAPTPPPSAPPLATACNPMSVKRSDISATRSDPSLMREVFSENQAKRSTATEVIPSAAAVAMSRCFPATQEYSELHDVWRQGSMVAADYGTISGSPADMNGPRLIRFGTSSTTSGDVSLTLGLRHAGNLPEKASFSVRDFGGS